MRLNLNFENINNISTNPFQERNWCKDINSKNEITEEDGFHFFVENEDITIWNGKKRLYFPLMSLGLRFENISDLNDKYNEKKEWFINKYPFIFKELSLLEMSDEDIADMIMPYLIQIGFNDNHSILYIEGDIKNDKMGDFSFSNYFNIDSNKKTFRALFDYKEYNLNVENESIILEMKAKTKELFNFISTYKK